MLSRAQFENRMKKSVIYKHMTNKSCFALHQGPGTINKNHRYHSLNEQISHYSYTAVI